MIVAEMLGVLGLQERALVMVKPPRQLRRTGILEIHDGVLLAVKHSILEWLRSLVRHSGVEEFRVGMNALAVEPRKDRGGGSPVKTLVVEANANLQCMLLPPSTGTPAALRKA